MTVQPTLVGGADRSVLGSAALASGRIDAVSPKFAEGLARVREVTDTDGACPAWAKALYMAAAAAVKGHREMLMAQMGRSRDLGLGLAAARGAALTVLISRGEAVYATFNSAIDEVFGDTVALAAGDAPEFSIDRRGCLDYFEDYFGFVPDYVRLMADDAPRALEGYVLMREWSLAENVLDATHAELLLCTINAAEFSARFVNVHANGARRAGCSEAQIVEAVICAIPVAGVASWLPGADGIMEGRP
ncbi:MAG: carboxymuconolactone decarboxylase family protein [bacterium]|nr:carboxymuconolactone decarboxylase family protein [bacterium]